MNFKPRKKNLFDIDTLFSLSITVLIIGVFLLNKENVLYDISIILISLINNFRYQKLNGNLNGELIFYENEIILNKRTISISEIKNIKIHIEDYKEQYLWRKTLKPKLQQGVKNFIEIEFLEGTTIINYFLQAKKNEITKVGNILKKYHSHNKIHFLHLIELLEINDYDVF